MEDFRSALAGRTPLGSFEYRGIWRFNFEKFGFFAGQVFPLFCRFLSAGGLRWGSFPCCSTAGHLRWPAGP